jgi:transcriptional regulator
VKPTIKTQAKPAINRRQMLSAVATAAAASAQTQTVYIPPRHKVEDLPYLQDFMDEYSFVDLVTSAPVLNITHIPILLDRKAPGSTNGTLFGHIARNNPQSKVLQQGNAKATIVFRGPHSYISPAWYKVPEAVPTWNFAVVHASGTLKPIEDKKALRALLSRLIAKFEANMPERSYDFDKLPDSYVNGMLGGIIGFEMPIESLEGKFKLGQERNETDKATVVEKLRKSKPERGIGEFTASFYQRKS